MLIPTKGIIQRMITRDIERVFFVLGARYKRNSTYKTAHNLGVLLSKYGHEIAFCPSKHLSRSEELLLYAKSKKESFVTLKELGDLYLKLQNYKEAILFYEQALHYQDRYDVLYNLCLCYYCSHHYMSVRELLKKFIKLSLFSTAEQVTLYEMYGVVCALTQDYQTAQDVLKWLRDTPDYSYSPETIKLAYLCKDYSFVFNNFQKIYAEWMVDSVDYLIIRQVFREKYAEQLEDFISWVDERVVDFYIENPEIKPDEELVNAMSSKDVFPTVQPIFVPVFSCDFY